ncbi:MAG: hypothetical protein HGA54_05255 [Actinobacteria bacterium]|nr:hypothetical protein [Actinomycetota bacterium]
MEGFGIIFVIVCELLALVLVVVLALYISKDSEKKSRIVTLCLLLAIAAFVCTGVVTLARINYVIPIGWIIGIALAVVVVVGLFIYIGKGVKWRIPKLVATVGVLVVACLMFSAPYAFDVGVKTLQPLQADRAGQIAESNDFLALLPPEQNMKVMYGYHVEPLDDPDVGFEIYYEDFTLQERKGSGASVAELEMLLAAGSRPMGQVAEAITSGGMITKTMVQGQPAVAIEFTFSGDPEKSKESGAQKIDHYTILVFELQGVDVRMTSWSGVTMPDGSFDPLGPSVEDLVTIAETMVPVE